ncbi:MAG: tRNA uridine-5-carboxymethylaminomethyl(34) synthesis GTPase MnmE [Kiloniellales bacterium]|jgi:tRNA modification GTPase
MDPDATIFALSSAPGRAGVAVLRLTGPQAGPALEALAGPLPPPRRAQLRRIGDPATHEAIDRGLVLWFPGPGSFTGEDMAELHLHGGRAVVAAAVEALGALPGLRPAEPGEFTRRAFDRGRLDLAEVEGLADLINAETEAQRRQALRQMEGAFSRQIEEWREGLTAALAHAEAAIDFPDEELPHDLEGRMTHKILGLERQITEYLDDRHRGERLREGLCIAILGPPNAGKSSLLNALARRDVAIVSETAGTTRDVIEVHLDLGGYPVTLLDTAGLRELDAGPAADGQAAEGQAAIEAEGIRRARAGAAAADLKLLVFDLQDAPDYDRATRELLDEDALAVLNKCDLVAHPERSSLDGRPAIALSAKTGAGLPALLDLLESEVAARLGGGGTAPALTRARHRAALEDCAEALRRAAGAGQPELIAEDLRLALRALGRIAGRVDVEDILDVIFRDFCIGK